MKFSIACFLAISATLTYVAFANNDSAPMSTEAKHWRHFSQPDEGRIKVEAVGNFRFPGTYYILEGTGLKYFYGICGGSGEQGDFGGGPPRMFSIIRIVDGEKKHIKIDASRLKLASVPDFELLEGDRVIANEIIF